MDRGTKSDGFDNYAWCLFDRPRPDSAGIQFIGRTNSPATTAMRRAA